MVDIGKIINPEEDIFHLRNTGKLYDSLLVGGYELKKGEVMTVKVAKDGELEVISLRNE